ncbi:hypothetical protein [Bacteroides sp. UBA939]|uniref:hypothetical protein n=1 Tax=Bacteroides sp. UBA939 TaxID=1946092 RepID=UPI0025C09D05|nr:hypothetical protein [Bacteroides sp. UBA939]
MKIRHFIICSIATIIVVLGCKKIPERSYSVWMTNKSKETISSYWALDPERHSYPDTTLSFGKEESIGYIIKPGNTSYGGVPLLTIEEWILRLPKDTLSIYIFSQDTVNKYSWSEIQSDYKVLRRYDLSIGDIHALYNEYDIPDIPYPPTEKMKNMKMYPPYH